MGTDTLTVLPQDISTLKIFFLEGPGKRRRAQNPGRVRGIPNPSQPRKEQAASKRGVGDWDKKPGVRAPPGSAGRLETTA